MRSFIAEFKAFILRGNVLDLAVAVVIGAAFTLVVNSFADDVLLQIVAAVFGKADFSSMFLTVNDTPIRFGAFFTALVNFVIVALGVFAVIKGVATLQNLRKREDELVESPAPSDEVLLLAEIRDLIARAQGPS